MFMTTIHELSKKVEEQALTQIEEREALNAQAQALNPASGLLSPASAAPTGVLASFCD